MNPARLFVVAVAGVAGLNAADSMRGEQLFTTQGCVQCHSVNGKGGKEAPDLGRRIARSYTPTLLASTMWNHAPSMWSAMRRQGIEPKALDPQSAADLFAFFSSSRFFDRPGDASRGKLAFAENGCSECHGITASIAQGAPPVNKWSALGDPIGFAESMWNHAGKMHEEFTRRNIPWPELTAQELSDILVYLRNLPGTRALPVRMQTTPGASGEALFESKGCARCHVGDLDLRVRSQGKTLTDMAAAMWNHAPKMQTAGIRFSPGEMNEILSYLWARRLVDENGNARRGERVFVQKHCSNCHGSDAAAPDLRTAKGREHSSLTMISALWRHGPTMLDRMKERSILWPRFTASEMSDLIAFLNAKPTRR
jgi:mono/diheme cytochrome c family protein